MNRIQKTEILLDILLEDMEELMSNITDTRLELNELRDAEHNQQNPQ